MKGLRLKPTSLRIHLTVIPFKIVLLFLCINTYGQIGINTTNPKGALDVTTINNTGLVLPRVSSIEDVTDGTINPPSNGTTVFDLSRNTTCFYLNDQWTCIDKDSNGNPVLTDGSPLEIIDYIKSSNNNMTDVFGLSLDISEDGNTLAVGTTYESSNATGIDGNQQDNSASISGAVYVFTKVAGEWSQQAYIKASNTETFDRFSFAISLSNDGHTLAVGAIDEDSSATGINGSEGDNSAMNSGAAFVFIRSGMSWSQQAYIKASNTEANDRFGDNLVLSGDGDTLAIAAWGEDSNATGINGNQSNNSAMESGAVYIYTRTGVTWSQQAYVKASNTDANDLFGRYLDLSFDGNTLAVSAEAEDSNATGINGDQNNNLSSASGAVYVYVRTANLWSQEAYIKASNTNLGDVFGGALNALFIAYGRLGNSIAISDDGNTLVVGTGGESSNAIGINGDENNNLSPLSGAVYVFNRSGSTWSQEAYIKASNAEAGEFFGTSVSISSDGNTLAVGAPSERSNATGVNGDETDNSIDYSGAVYLFKRVASVWTQHAYIKASNTGVDPFFINEGDSFGYAIAISGDGNKLASGAPLEDSDATGINGNQTDNSSQNAGAVYIYTFN